MSKDRSYTHKRLQIKDLELNISRFKNKIKAIQLELKCDTTCADCGKHFKELDKLQKHTIKYHHSHQCHICRRKFSSIEKVTKHNNNGEFCVCPYWHPTNNKQLMNCESKFTLLRTTFRTKN